MLETELFALLERTADAAYTVTTDAALKRGATREEIVEALGVAIAVNAGAALIYSTRVLDAATAKTQTTEATDDGKT